MRVTYLFNSGFLVQLNHTWLIFDDCDDPSQTVDGELTAQNGAILYVFASHAHFDHFDPHILNYAPQTTQYIFGRDIKRTRRAKRFPPDKVTYMPDYSEWTDGNIKVTSFSSTDVGTSFLVEAEGQKIFHAGDFNWWHWTGASGEEQALARNAFMKQMKKLRGMDADVAFFPVDGRLGEARDMGAKFFCAETNIGALVTMHNVGFEPWSPSPDFWTREKIPFWSPTVPGESRTLSPKGFIS